MSSAGPPVAVDPAAGPGRHRDLLSLAAGTDSEAEPEQPALALVLWSAQAVAAPAAPAAPAPPSAEAHALVPVRARPLRRQDCGKGRWGSIHERKLVATLMHYGKLRHKAVRVERQQCDSVVQCVNQARLGGRARRNLAKVLPVHWKSKRFGGVHGIRVIKNLSRS